MPTERERLTRQHKKRTGMVEHSLRIDPRWHCVRSTLFVGRECTAAATSHVWQGWKPEKMQLMNPKLDAVVTVMSWRHLHCALHHSSLHNRFLNHISNCSRCTIHMDTETHPNYILSHTQRRCDVNVLVYLIESDTNAVSFHTSI